MKSRQLRTETTKRCLNISDLTASMYFRENIWGDKLFSRVSYIDVSCREFLLPFSRESWSTDRILWLQRFLFRYQNALRYCMVKCDAILVVNREAVRQECESVLKMITHNALCCDCCLESWIDFAINSKKAESPIFVLYLKSSAFILLACRLFHFLSGISRA